MYELPSRDDVRKCVISGETVTQRRRPLLATDSGQPVLTAGTDEADEAETVQESA